VLENQNTPKGMPTTSWLEPRYVLYWLEKGTQRRYCVFCEKKE